MRDCRSGCGLYSSLIADSSPLPPSPPSLLALTSQALTDTKYTPSLYTFNYTALKEELMGNTTDKQTAFIFKIETIEETSYLFKVIAHFVVF